MSTTKATGTTKKVIVTNPISSVSNSQSPGIGRLACLDGLVVINNLGRNLQFGRLEHDQLTTLAWSDYTAFPHLDDESQFDLDFHAVALSRGFGVVGALNHYGFINWYRTGKIKHAGQVRQLAPRLRTKWAADVECVRLAANWLIGTSPRGYEVPDPALPGVIATNVTETLVQTATAQSGLNDCLPFETQLEDWGYTSAIATSDDETKLAVAAHNRVAVFTLPERGSKFVLEQPLLETTANFFIDWLSFTDEGKGLVCAGYDLKHVQAQQTGWDAIGGGGWMIVDIDSGESLAGAAFSIDLAWGNGAVPIVMGQDSRSLFAVDKHAGLHRFDLRHSTGSIVCPPSETKNIGMAHMDRQGAVILCGFNRDGYRVHLYKED